jgi:hydrogenase expression/formation protein HypE
MNKNLKSTPRILLDHGSGGKISHDLITRMFLPIFDNDMLYRLDDGAVFQVSGTRLAFSTDSFVVDPIFFPGGSIGDLAVNGTVNDLAMCGATPLYLSAGLIIEEGLPTEDLERILRDMATAARLAGVTIVTGDTKVVPKGAADLIFVNTSGVGVIADGINISGKNARPGDKIILSGTIADHGMTILAQRSELAFDAQISSDTAALNGLVQAMMSVCQDIHTLRDPTRGGLATTLKEIALQSSVGIRIRERNIPVKDAVLGLCELLGFDPLYVANEGKLVACVAGAQADAVLSVVKAHSLGGNAAIIGEVVETPPGQVLLETGIGGIRIVDMLAGEQLPRIC